ncbi:MAG: ribosome assembly factor SBDS [Acidilobaceae archaeon]|jgi:ribosome maturation protein SDO1|nr:ribosome assembly factor SBDS [Desulfurococcaceae archaeon]MCC6060726.1 ribosome assembly factor SBDS [Desulfurococcaceae archaeon]MDT7866203.1 ribosome assembly factor SBDS [Desulfurococcales archaeon]
MSRKSYVVAWIEIKGERFEVLVRPEQAFRYREGEKVDLGEILWTDTIYKDSRKGLKASPESLRKAFGTEDVRVIAERILKEGRIQLTEEERRRLLEAKRRKIITYIVRNAVDPKTGMPIPESRIEAAMEELGVSIDLYRDAESQALEIVSKLSRIMPIKIARALIEAVIPPDIAGRVVSEVKRIGDVRRSEWLKDGSLKLEVEVPAGAQIDVINRIQGLAKGRASVNVKVVG